MRPLPALDEPRRQQPHEAGEADDLDACASSIALQRALERLAVLAEVPVIDDRGGDAGAARAWPGPARPDRWRGPARSRPDRRDPSRPRSARPCWSRGRRSGRRRACGIALTRRDRGARDRRRAVPPLGCDHVPSRTTRFACALRAPSATASSRRRPTTAIMPMPQLKVRSISGSAMPPVAASQRNTGGTGTLARSMRTPSRFGSTRGMLSGKPPPVMWASALTAVGLADRGEAGLHVDAGRRQQRLAERALASSNGAGASPCKPRSARPPCAPANSRWNARRRRRARARRRRRRCRRAAGCASRSTAPTAKPARS